MTILLLPADYLCALPIWQVVHKTCSTRDICFDKKSCFVTFVKMSIFGDFLPFPFGILELKALIMCDIKVNIEDNYFDLLFVLTIS